MIRMMEVREVDKDRYRTCCTVCHIKFGTAVLGVIEALASIGVLLSATQQVVWKNGGSHHCMDNFLRDCLIFQFSHFDTTLTFDYILIIMMIFVLFSIFSLFCGIIFDTSCLLLPHILMQGIFLLFSIGYFCLYAVSYFYGDLHMQSRNFEVNRFLERMWLATLLLALSGFQSYLFSAVIRCSMYISTIEDNRRRRESAFQRCSERVRLAKENGLWRRTSWGGGFQQYKGQYDENRPKKTGKEKGVRVQWSLQRQNIAEEDELDVQIQNYEPQPDTQTLVVKLETMNETIEAEPHNLDRTSQQRKRSSESSKKDQIIHSSSVHGHSTRKSSTSPQRQYSEKVKRDLDCRPKHDTEQYGTPVGPSMR
ncbi:hypothetical protein KIN20_007351 [Parelaphostrongylus tenuis]|uniref:Uncharacterized protein n=1 Tax=Parelaphostrongylus tenuis TaxID=148309 RepID=A0AAD5MVE7_PARTN|nr:hypothetical protein KIN20_007351 [Parelaphostrongylus tenuis]